jgi:Glycoside Hydrolase Family 113
MRRQKNSNLSQLKKWTILLLVLLLPCLLALNRGQSQAAGQVVKQKGMSFVAWWGGAYSTPDADQSLAELKAAGPDWVSVIVVRYQDTFASTTIYSSPATASDADLVHVINRAHSLGLKVMLKPHVDLANDPDHWRGNIGQGFSEADWIAWFISYKDMINHYAQLAQTLGVEQFCVGTELVSTEFRATDWQSVIAGVRALFTGPLTYAANPGDEASISWWDKLDFIGFDAYYALTNKNDPTLAELKAAWVPIAAILKNLSETWGKPVIFPEVGYASSDGANQHPWQSAPGDALDLQEQADLYQALFETFYNQAWFAGVFWFPWETNPLVGGPCDKTGTPHDKPAEDILRLWYGTSPRPAAAQLPGLDYTHTMPVYTDALGTGWDSWSWGTGATFDFAFTGTTAVGAYAISSTTPTYGAVALHHDAFDSSPYYWLELYVYKSSEPSKVAVWFNDENDNMLRDRPVEDCRYTGGQPITAGVWTRVLIPLKDLDASNRLLSRLSIGNGYDQPLTYYLDEVRLVAASWKLVLPLVVKP